MRTLLSSALALFISLSSAEAHPGSGIAVDAQGRVFVTMGAAIVMLDVDGKARTIVSDPKDEKFFQLHQIRHAPDGGLLTASDKGNAIWHFTAEGKLTRFYPPPFQIAPLQVGTGGDPFEVDADGNVYVINSGQFKFTQILKVSPRGEIAFIAGGDWGHADGVGVQAKFGNLHGSAILAGKDGTLYLTDDAQYVRKVTATGQVSTLAGDAGVGFADGPAEKAKFNTPTGLALDGDGNVLVADTGNHRIRKITREGVVSTLAGSGRKGAADASGLEATFDEPTGITVAPSGEVFVLEIAAERVRKISKAGKVTTAGRVSPESPPAR
jgi:streptogramin lyase